MAKNDLTFRTGTHQAQANPQTVSSSTQDFMVNIACLAINQPCWDCKFIINMYQTPVFFSMHSTKLVDMIGSHTINTRIAKNGSQRATADAFLLFNYVAH